MCQLCILYLFFFMSATAVQVETRPAPVWFYLGNKLLSCSHFVVQCIFMSRESDWHIDICLGQLLKEGRHQIFHLQPSNCTDIATETSHLLCSMKPFEETAVEILCYTLIVPYIFRDIIKPTATCSLSIVWKDTSRPVNATVLKIHTLIKGHSWSQYLYRLIYLFSLRSR